MIRRQLGYLVHPAIPVREDAMIADVACGTSIWALDVAKQYPNVTSHGFDISTEQYPHPRWIPRKVTLGTLDLLKPIPEHLRGKYDMVHVGVVVCIVENSHPSAFLDNILLLLSMTILPSVASCSCQTATDSTMISRTWRLHTVG